MKFLFFIYQLVYNSNKVFVSDTLLLTQNASISISFTLDINKDFENTDSTNDKDGWSIFNLDSSLTSTIKIDNLGVLGITNWRLGQQTLNICCVKTLKKQCNSLDIQLIPSPSGVLGNITPQVSTNVPNDAVFFTASTSTSNAGKKILYIKGITITVDSTNPMDKNNLIKQTNDNTYAEIHISAYRLVITSSLSLINKSLVSIDSVQLTIASQGNIIMTQTNGNVGGTLLVNSEFYDLKCTTCFTTKGADGNNGMPGTKGADGLVVAIANGPNYIMWMGSGTSSCPTNGANGSPGTAGANSGDKGLVKSNIPSSYFVSVAGIPGLGGCGIGGAAGGPPGQLASAWQEKHCTGWCNCNCHMASQSAVICNSTYVVGQTICASNGSVNTQPPGTNYFTLTNQDPSWISPDFLYTIMLFGLTSMKMGNKNTGSQQLSEVSRIYTQLSSNIDMNPQGHVATELTQLDNHLSEGLDIWGQQTQFTPMQSPSFYFSYFNSIATNYATLICLSNKIKTQMENNSQSFTDIKNMITLSSNQETELVNSIKTNIQSQEVIQNSLVDIEASIKTINSDIQSRAVQITQNLNDKNKKSKFSKFIGTAAKIMNIVNVCFPNPFTMGAAVILDVANTFMNQNGSVVDKVSGLVKTVGDLKSAGPTISSQLDTVATKIFSAKWDGNPVDYAKNLYANVKATQTEIKKTFESQKTSISKAISDTTTSMAAIQQATNTIFDQDSSQSDLKNKLIITLQRRSSLLEQLKTNLQEATKLSSNLASLQIQHIALERSLQDIPFLSSFSANVINNLLLNQTAIFDEITYMMSKALEQITLTSNGMYYSFAEILIANEEVQKYLNNSDASGLVSFFNAKLQTLTKNVINFQNTTISHTTTFSVPTCKADLIYLSIFTVQEKQQNFQQLSGGGQVENAYINNIKLDKLQFFVVSGTISPNDTAKVCIRYSGEFQVQKKGRKQYFKHFNQNEFNYRQCSLVNLSDNTITFQEVSSSQISLLNMITQSPNNQSIYSRPGLDSNWNLTVTTYSSALLLITNIIHKVTQDFTDSNLNCLLLQVDSNNKWNEPPMTLIYIHISKDNQQYWDTNYENTYQICSQLKLNQNFNIQIPQTISNVIISEIQINNVNQNGEVLQFNGKIQIKVTLNDTRDFKCNSGICFDCKKGYYMSPYQKYQFDYNSSCFKCSLGSYSDDKNAASCLKCGSGTQWITSDLRDSQSKACATCPMFTQSNVLDGIGTACSTCPPNYIANFANMNTGQTNVSDVCKYCDNDSCKQMILQTFEINSATSKIQDESIILIGNNATAKIVVLKMEIPRAYISGVHEVSGIQYVEQVATPSRFVRRLTAASSISKFCIPYASSEPISMFTSIDGLVPWTYLENSEQAEDGSNFWCQIAVHAKGEKLSSYVKLFELRDIDLVLGLSGWAQFWQHAALYVKILLCLAFIVIPPILIVIIFKQSIYWFEKNKIHNQLKSVESKKALKVTQEIFSKEELTVFVIGFARQGKSRFLNAALNGHFATTSSGGFSCTSTYKSYQGKFLGKQNEIKYIDTVGQYDTTDETDVDRINQKLLIIQRNLTCTDCKNLTCDECKNLNDVGELTKYVNITRQKLITLLQTNQFDCQTQKIVVLYYHIVLKQEQFEQIQENKLLSILIHLWKENNMAKDDNNGNDQCLKIIILLTRIQIQQSIKNEELDQIIISQITSVKEHTNYFQLILNQQTTNEQDVFVDKNLELQCQLCNEKKQKSFFNENVEILVNYSDFKFRFISDDNKCLICNPQKLINIKNNYESVKPIFQIDYLQFQDNCIDEENKKKLEIGHIDKFILVDNFNISEIQGKKEELIFNLRMLHKFANLDIQNLVLIKSKDTEDKVERYYYNPMHNKANEYYRDAKLSLDQLLSDSDFELKPNYSFKRDQSRLQTATEMIKILDDVFIPSVESKEKMKKILFENTICYDAECTNTDESQMYNYTSNFEMVRLQQIINQNQDNINLNIYNSNNVSEDQINNELDHNNNNNNNNNNNQINVYEISFNETEVEFDQNQPGVNEQNNNQDQINENEVFVNVIDNTNREDINEMQTYLLSMGQLIKTDFESNLVEQMWLNCNRDRNEFFEKIYPYLEEL